MERLTQEQFEAIRKRAEAATEGPWKYNAQYGYLAPVIPQRHIAAICNEITREGDADFIAHAREDIPALLAEVERLRATLGEIACEDEWETVDEARNIAREALQNG